MDAERPQRVDHRVGYRRQRPGGAGFARALHAERVAGRGNRAVVEPRLGLVVGTRHDIVHESAVEQLAAVGIVHALFAYRLAEPLRDAAVQLALEQRVVDYAPAVVHRDIAQHSQLAGVRIDLHLGDMRAARVGTRLRNIAARIERMRRLAGVAARDLLQRDRDVRAFHAVPSMLKLQVLSRNLQRLGGELRSLAHHLARGHGDRAAVGHHRARADRAVAHQGRTVGVAGVQEDLLRIHAEDFGGDLRIHRLVALPGRARDSIDAGVTRVAEADLDFFLRAAAGAGRLDEHGAADAAQLAALLCFFTPAFESLPVGPH